MLLFLTLSAHAEPPVIARAAAWLEGALAQQSGRYAGEGYDGQLGLSVQDTRVESVAGGWRIDLDAEADAHGTAVIERFGRSVSCEARIAPTPITLSVMVAVEGARVRVSEVGADLSALTAEQVDTCVPSDTVDSALIALLVSRLEAHRASARQAVQAQLRRGLRATATKP